jgi:hypothetical protein
MRKNRVTFAELRELLLELGFAESIPHANRLRFEYPATGTVLLFPAHDGSDPVGDRDLVVIRRQLVDNGLIEARALDRFLERASA